MWRCWVCETRHANLSVGVPCTGMAEKRSEEESACCVVSVTHSGSFGAWRLFLVGFGTSEREGLIEVWIETWQDFVLNSD